jgi:hypothetical protein
VWPGLQRALFGCAIELQFDGRLLHLATQRAEWPDEVLQQSHQCVEFGKEQRELSHAFQHPHSHVPLGHSLCPVRQWQLTESAQQHPQAPASADSCPSSTDAAPPATAAIESRPTLPRKDLRGRRAAIARDAPLARRSIRGSPAVCSAGMVVTSSCRPPRIKQSEFRHLHPGISASRRGAPARFA